MFLFYLQPVQMQLVDETYTRRCNYELKYANSPQVSVMNGFILYQSRHWVQL